MLEDGTLSALAAIPTPSPPASDYQVFTPEQWMTLLSICEVFMPSFSSGTLSPERGRDAKHILANVLPDSEDDKLLDSFLAETVADSARFKESLRKRFAAYIPEAQSKGLAFLLSALNTRLGSIVMTGNMECLHLQALPERTRIVLNWSNSSIGPLRALYNAAETLTKATWAAQSTTLHKLLDYPKVPKQIERHPSYDFNFLDFSDKPEDQVVQVNADVVIVGSGCGAGVVAEHLSSSLTGTTPKPRILVLEKSYHFPSTHYPMDQDAAGENIQEAGGAILADNGSIAVLAGSTWGGGGTINWSASLQPQRFVREDWAAKNKLPFALSQEFQACLDEVCSKMGVCEAHDLEGLAKIEHNFANKALMEGARRLGLEAKVVPQNTAGQRHYCGRCGMGCASATKQGPANFWLPAAAENGVEFIEGCFAENIVWHETAPTSRKAAGIRATWTSRSRDISRKLNISAKHIVISSGTLHSPLLLHRSGVTPEINKHIGSNLHLHPSVQVRGTYPKRVDPWDGPILTSVMTSLETSAGNGHGTKSEVMLGIPELTAAVMPFRPQLTIRAMGEAKQKRSSIQDAALTTALDWRLRLAKHGYSFCYVVIQRDHADDSNSRKCYVYNDPDDVRKVKINYNPSTKDRECLLNGAIATARMHYVSGAETIEIFSPDVELFEKPSIKNHSKDQATDDAAFEDWVSNIKTCNIALLDPRKNRLGSAHQMSTCRMAGNPEVGVVDPAGKVWGTDNVYVADASILPSASGVNPMISTMGLSLHVAKGLAETIEAHLDEDSMFVSPA